jgi:hypothetical protein
MLKMLERLCDRRSFIGAMGARIVAFVGAVCGLGRLAKAGSCNCGGLIAGCCLCFEPTESCQEDCGEESVNEWTWASTESGTCYECFTLWPGESVPCAPSNWCELYGVCSAIY